MNVINGYTSKINVVNVTFSILMTITFISSLPIRHGFCMLFSWFRTVISAATSKTLCRIDVVLETGRATIVDDEASTTRFDVALRVLAHDLLVDVLSDTKRVEHFRVVLAH